MAEPLSIVAGSVGLADVCIRLTKVLKQAKDGFQKVDQDLEDLAKEVEALFSVNNSIKCSFEADLAGGTLSNDQQILADHWKATQTTLASCQEITERLNGLVIEVWANDNPRHVKLSSLRKYLKLQSKEEEFTSLRRKLNDYRIALLTSLTVVNVISMRNSRSTSNESFSGLSKKIQSLGADLQANIVSLQASVQSNADNKLDIAVKSAQNVVPLASLNEHFYTPQTVSSIFTGRIAELNALRKHTQASTSPNQFHPQKRFVIVGLPGSGKTQFCCKFASDNKHSFWGVFWIDATSNEHAKQSFATIARVGKVEPNERAAKSWLSSLGKEKPWLLIVDNADDENFPVENCYPDGDDSVILITTRNPLLTVHGTIGPRSYHFDELEESASIELLLRAANEPFPWPRTSIEPAKNIARTLGNLPLALVHAGKTIFARLCTLEDYLDFFEKNWTRIRKNKSSNNTTLSISDANDAIYSSFELIYDGLVAKKTQSSEDSLDLLKVFSFLHRQRIRVEIFSRAVVNPPLEMLERKRQEQEEKEVSGHKQKNITWAQTFKRTGLGIFSFLWTLGNRPVLPRLLSDGLNLELFDELRFREALKELFQMSLIFANPDDSYSMHPAVHLWVRERPEMRIADQAVWCHAAATILSRAILLPPLGDKEADEIFRRDLLPHVGHVQHNERAIRARLLENQKTRKRIWPVLGPRLDRDQAMQLVKFSLVYTQCGLLEDAEKLQLKVADFAIKTLGMEHPSTMDILLLLSSTYWQLTRGEEAADLQQRVLEACIHVRGKSDLKTLKIMNAYGSSRWLQGRIPEARKIHETTVEGLTRVLGADHIETLKAMGNLGRAIGKDFRFSEAIKLHLKVVSGLRQQLGASHLETLTAMDSLAMAYFDRAAFGYAQPGDLDRAVAMEKEVFDQRKEKLGREHIFTLWAGLNLSRIKGLRGEIDEALAIFLAGHEIARRNLGENHFGVLWGKLHYGRILTYAKRYREAEDVLLEVMESHDGPRKGHPDRLLAIFSLIKCRNLQGKQAETKVLLEELTESTVALFGENHAWVKYLLDPQNLSTEPEDDVIQPIQSAGGAPETAGPSEESIPQAMIAKYGHI